MITPRTTRLLRVPDLRAMHDVIAGTVTVSPPAGAPSCAVIVPSGGAADELRRTVHGADILTRREFYAELHHRLTDAPPVLSGFEREVMLRRAAREAAASGTEPPFQLRPGLIVQMLAFYDELRLRNRTLDDFARLMVESLAPSAEIDRGAERMLRQTHFLAAALGAFELLVSGSGRLDEHGLRTLLLAQGCARPYRHVIVTSADQAADAGGLWPADFDLLARMPGIVQLDVVATEALLAAGFDVRIHQALPGIEEHTSGNPSAPPVLAAPEPAPGAESQRWFVCRDREEELVSVARAVHADAPTGPLERAVVFQRPLPYLYLSRQVFADAGLPYQAQDSLPLAAEPFVAALDLAFTFFHAEGTRGSTIELLRSPHWCFAADRQPLDGGAIAAADDLLQDLKYLGSFERLASIAADAEARASTPASANRRRASLWTRSVPALQAACSAAAALSGIAAARSASEQVSALVAFIKDHEQLPSQDDPWAGSHLRARGAVLTALVELGDAHSRHDDRPLSMADLWANLRRWIEGQTFSSRTGTAGVRLIDASAAAYARVDDARIAGLVESDWPERSRRSIFYPPSLLGQLGWPSETDRLAAARARFRDLLSLPAARVSLSTFTLEDDAIVPPSAFLEEVETAGLRVERVSARNTRVLVHEALSEDPVVVSAVAGTEAEWLALRMSRVAARSDVVGAIGPRQQAVYAVSHVERYLDCPFKYFAAHVLQLPEERDDDTGLTPQERGQFLHDVFEAFFREWHVSGMGAITIHNVADALALFERVAEARLLSLGEADRALERTHLLGSAVSSGLAERAFAFEIDHGAEIVERLLEYELQGNFEFRTNDTTRLVPLRAKADRIDLLTDGTLRVIDYKLGRAPKASRALQLPVYGLCAEQALKGHRGRDWTLSRAAYVAFRERNPYVGLGASSSLAEALAAGQATFLETIDAIESGAFPVDPDEPYRCQWCAYPTVCRKDYVGDE